MTTVTIDNATAGLWEWQGRVDQDWSWADIQTIVERVNRGALLLDERNPDWVSEVIPEKLDMANSSFCIIGQTYGTYDDYIGVPFGMQADDYAGAEEKAIEHGFLTESEARDEMIPYPLLDRVWVYMLQERSVQGRPVTLKLGERRAFNVVVDELIREKLLKQLGEDLVEVA